VTEPQENSGPILVLAPRGRDASVIAHVLLQSGHSTSVCASLREMLERLSESALAAIVTEENLKDDGALDLQDWIARQPQWSDFPFVVLATRQVGSRTAQASNVLAKLGNGVLLERPLNAETLLSAANSAIRSRRRQYETRSHLQLQETVGAENRRLYEAERQARADAEAANRAKDEFLATLSHELRTPLSAILGWTYVLQQRRDDLGDLARGVDTIERNARAQARLIEDLLDMSRIVAGKVSLELQTVVPANVVEQVIASVLPSIQAKHIEIERSLSAAMVPIVADPQRLSQVFWNLLTNAVKFTGEGGRIAVDASTDGDEMVLRVTDSGVGIAPSFLPQVFERFRQADGSTTRSHGGLGLGLAIVKRLTELHGGRVTATSAGLGAGATFTVRLPIAEDRPFASGAWPPSGHGAPGGEAKATPSIQDVRVLLVEDDPDGRDMVEHVLSENGGHVRAVDCAAEALKALAESTFDVVVSDIGMPEVDGYELLNLIRARGNLVPAIALTAFARAEDRDKALVAGYAAHLSKPVEPPALIAAVAEVGRRH
jgi:signal transduction histidine kinase